MRYSYGIMDRRKVLSYKPQLFLKTNDILVFPSKDFHLWHSGLKEYIDSLYQINSHGIGRGESINLSELDLAVAVLNNISEELEDLFDVWKEYNLDYQYVSNLDDKYKKRRGPYSSDMRRCDVRIPVRPEITPWLKMKHVMEIVEESWRIVNRTKKISNSNDIIISND